MPMNRTFAERLKQLKENKVLFKSLFKFYDLLKAKWGNKNNLH